MNQTIRLEKIPERIVSLVPSQTELLYDLGLGDNVTGITKFCIHPDEWFRSKTRVGGTKNINHDVIKELNPDLIIGNKEENSEADILNLQASFPVYMSDIFTTEDALKMIADLGILTARESEATTLIQQIQADFADFPRVKGTVLYLIWANPYMAVGNHTFIGDMLKKFGLQNVISGEQVRYIELTNEQIAALNPDYIFLSSEPFPFKENHAVDLAGISASRLCFTDGEMFSWYGSRMKKMKAYFSVLAEKIAQSAG